MTNSISQQQTERPSARTILARCVLPLLLCLAVLSFSTSRHILAEEVYNNFSVTPVNGWWGAGPAGLPDEDVGPIRTAQQFMLDGSVDMEDFLALSANYGNAGGWADGDLDGDGHVRFPDFVALSANFGGVAATAGANAAAVPEPTSAGLALFGLLGLMGIRKRRSSTEKGRLSALCRTQSPKLSGVLATVLGLMIPFAARAETKLVKVGDPVFDVTGGLVVIPAANPSSGFEPWWANVDRVLDEVRDGTHITVFNNCWDCPLKPHDGPYDQEIRQGMVDAGHLITDAFTQGDDLAPPGTLFIPAVVTPNADAPTGPSFENPSGPIIPNSIFPLSYRMEMFNSGSSVGSVSRSVRALDRNVGPFRDRHGETHDLDFTGLNYSHLALYSANARHPGGNPNNSQQRIGDNKIVRTIRDANGNGWDVIEEYTIVAEATDIVGDLNYSGGIDFGDYNIMRENLDLGSNHERLNIDGDDVVSEADMAHLVDMFPSPAIAPLTVGDTYNQDFDSMGTNGYLGSALPTAWTVTDGKPFIQETNATFPTSRRDVISVSDPIALNAGVTEGAGASDRSLAIYNPSNASETSSIQLLADTDKQAHALKIDFSVEAWDRLRGTNGNRDGGEAAFNLFVEIDDGDGTSDMAKILGGDFTELVDLGKVTTGAQLPAPEGDYLDGNDPAHRVAFASDVLHADIPAGSRLRFRWETTAEADASEEWIFGIDDVSITLGVAGDTNLDGEVKFDDFLALANNFGEEGGWEQGDFDGNGEIEFPDFLALAENFSGGSNAAAASVPEPASASFALLGLLGLIVFRRRR